MQSGLSGTIATMRSIAPRPFMLAGMRARLASVVVLSLALAALASSAEAVAATPPLPTGLTAQVVQTSVYLRWQKDPESGITGYPVYKQRADGTWVTAGVASGAIYLVSNLTSGVTYTYRVAATSNEGKTSAPSEPVTFTPHDTIPPPVPTGLAATGEDEQVHLSWSVSTASDFDHFVVYRENQNGTWPTSGSSTTTAAFTDTGVIDGTTYSYRITAVDHAGNESAPSTTASAAAHDSTAPVAPEGATATSGEDGQVTLSWGASTERAPTSTASTARTLTAPGRPPRPRPSTPPPDSRQLS